MVATGEIYRKKLIRFPANRKISKIIREPKIGVERHPIGEIIRSKGEIGMGKRPMKDGNGVYTKAKIRP